MNFNNIQYSIFKILTLKGLRVWVHKRVSDVFVNFMMSLNMSSEVLSDDYNMIVCTVGVR